MTVIGKRAIWLSIPLALMVGGCGWLVSPAQPPKADQRQAAVEAVFTLRQLAESKDPVVRCNAIEALSETVGAREAGVYMQALSDANPMVQFAGAMALGDVRYEGAREALLAMANAAGPDKRVYAAVIYALYRLKDTSHMGDLARLLLHAEPEVRADAVLVIGKIGEPSGIDPLRQLLAAETDPKVRLQTVESLALLGDGRGKSNLEAYTHTRFVDEQLVAIRAIGRVRPDRWELILEDAMSEHQPVPVRVAAGGAAAQLGDYSMRNYQLCVDAVENPNGLLAGRFGKEKDVNPVEATMVRRLGAISLGYMNRPQAVDVLLPLLRAEDGTIRVVAAMSILRLIPPAYITQPETQPARTQPAPPAATSPAATMPSVAASEPAAPTSEPATAPSTPASAPSAAPTAGTAASEPATMPQPEGVSTPSRPRLRSSGARD